MGKVLKKSLLEFSFTRDKLLLSKYKELKETLSAKDRRLIGFRELNEALPLIPSDSNDLMLIIHNENTVYGGACLRISTPDYPVILNLEQDILPTPGKFYFSIKESCPHLALDRYAYSEFDEIILHPSLRGGKYVRMIFKMMLEYCAKEEVRYMFAVSDNVRARLYSQVWNSLGINISVADCIDIPLKPEHENLKRRLLYGDMIKFFSSETTISGQPIVEEHVAL